MTESEPHLPPGPPDPVTDRLRRARQGRLVAGVAAGVARYLDIDVTVVRIALVALTFVGGVGIPVYIAGWLLMPEEDEELSMAESWLAHGGYGPQGDYSPSGPYGHYGYGAPEYAGHQAEGTSGVAS